MSLNNSSNNQANTSGWKNSFGPRKRQGAKPAAGSADDYQRFLEFLDQSGQAESFKQKLFQAHLYKKKQPEG